jgi:IS30 family transposase
MGRRYKQLSLEERCEIARLQGEGRSIRQILRYSHRTRNTASTTAVPIEITFQVTTLLCPV